MARSGRDIKAISQNIGHTHLSTTLKQYANMQPQEYMQIIKGLTFRIEEQAMVCDLSDDDLIEILHSRKERKVRNNF